MSSEPSLRSAFSYFANCTSETSTIQDIQNSEELLTVTCAGRPPVSGGVDDRVAGCLRMILIDKGVDPRDHLRLREAVTFIAAILVVLDVQSPGKSLAVLGPAPPFLIK